VVADDRVRMDHHAMADLTIAADPDILRNDRVMPELRAISDPGRWMDKAVR
jgi:hypothetical protein